MSDEQLKSPRQQFKIGDKAWYRGNIYELHGRVGIIESIDESLYHNLFINFSHPEYDGRYSSSEMELYDKELVMLEHQTRHITPCPEIDTCTVCGEFCNKILEHLNPKSEALEKNRKRGPGGAPTRTTILPIEASERKKFPIASGVLDYFPDAIVAISQISYAGNEQHNPGLPLQWTRGKSTDEADTCMRHFLQRGTFDSDGMRHTAKAAWRMLALLQKELETDV